MSSAAAARSWCPWRRTRPAPAAAAAPSSSTMASTYIAMRGCRGRGRWRRSATTGSLRRSVSSTPFCSSASTRLSLRAAVTISGTSASSRRSKIVSALPSTSATAAFDRPLASGVVGRAGCAAGRTCRRRRDGLRRRPWFGNSATTLAACLAGVVVGQRRSVASVVSHGRRIVGRIELAFDPAASGRARSVGRRVGLVCRPRCRRRCSSSAAVSAPSSGVSAVVGGCRRWRRSARRRSASRRGHHQRHRAGGR